MKTSSKEGKLIRSSLLEKMDGKCALCLRGPFCSACYIKVEHTSPCERVQKVNTIDHNHSCPHNKGEWCEKCVRGVLHSRCNWQLCILEENLHLQSPFVMEYLKRGNQLTIEQLLPREKQANDPEYQQYLALKEKFGE